MNKVELQDIYKLADMLYALCRQYEQQNKEQGKRWEFGEKALALVGDFPLYAPTSNLTYADALAVASVINGDIEKATAEKELM